MKRMHSEEPGHRSGLHIEPEIRIDITANGVHVGKTELAAFIAAQLKKFAPEVNVVVRSQDGDLHHHTETLNQGGAPKLRPGTLVTIIDRNSGFVPPGQWPSEEQTYTIQPPSEKPTNESVQ